MILRVNTILVVVSDVCLNCCGGKGASPIGGTECSIWPVGTRKGPCETVHCPGHDLDIFRFLVVFLITRLHTNEAVCVCDRLLEEISANGLRSL